MVARIKTLAGYAILMKYENFLLGTTSYSYILLVN